MQCSVSVIEMLPYLLELFIIIYILVLVLGFLQTPPLSLTPKNLSAEEAADQAHNAKVYGITAVSVIAVQAIVAVSTLAGTSAFPIAAVFVAFTLLSHHTIIHWRSRFEGETCSCAPFQLKDISNHETWVVAALVAATISQFRV